MTMITMTAIYMYSTHRDRAGMLAWKDLQTGRFIKAATVAKRTGLPLTHIKSYENGPDGRGHRMPRDEREAIERDHGVCLTS